MKNYVGNGWESKYGISITLKKDKINSLPVNEYGEIKLIVAKRKARDEKSKATHYVVENDYKKNEQSAPKIENNKGDWYQTKNENKDLPF